MVQIRGKTGSICSKEARYIIGRDPAVETQQQRAALAAVGSIVADDGRKPSLFCTELTPFCQRFA